MKSIKNFLIIFILSQMALNAQTSDVFQYQRQYFGISGGLNIITHNTDFKQLAEIPNCCPLFQKGDGLGFAIRAIYEQPLISFFALEARLSVNSLPGKFSSYESFQVVKNNQLVDGQIEHYLEAKLFSLSLEPLIKFRYYGFGIFTGISFSTFLKKDFYQVEKLVQPQDFGTFENGLRIRNEYEGEISKMNFLNMSYIIGIHYDIPLSGQMNFFLSPEIVYSYGLNSVLTDNDWKINLISVGLSFKITRAWEFATPLKPQSK